MVAPFTLSPSSTFLSPTKTLKRFSALNLSKRQPWPLSVTSLHKPGSDIDSPPLPPNVQTFLQWLRDEGVVSAKAPARPALVPEGLGLVAQRDLSRNEVVLEVPKREKLKSDSPWRYYLDILPEYTNSTIYWSEEELAELKGTQLLSTTLSVKEYVQNEFLKVEEEIISPHKQFFPSPITLDDFFWAFGILRSRAFSRLRGQNLVLIPLADLINHSPSITTEDHAWEIKGAAGLFTWDTLFLYGPLFLSRLVSR
ncbi:hypothetical protein SLA2020_449270 [Shorea laevis]